MSNDNLESSATFMQIVARLLDSALTRGTNFDTVITILALLSLLSLLNRNTQTVITNSSANTTSNPFQKLLGDLTKGDNGPGPESLMSLLPLLNNPQIKSKLNPTTLSAILGLMNNLGHNSDKSSKSSTSKSNDKADNVKSESLKASPPAQDPEQPAAASTLYSPDSIEISNDSLPASTVTNPISMSNNNNSNLNWKNSF